MSEIVGMFAISHAPSWDVNTEVEGPGSRFAAAAQSAMNDLRKLEPSVTVVFGPDHFRNFFYDVLPAFCVGVREVEAIGDYTSPEGPLPGMESLGRHIHAYLMDNGYDPAISLRMGIDHGISQPYSLFDPALKLPLVPIMTNCSGAPRPSFKRCFDFGRTVAEAIANDGRDDRVLVVGSGGLSHWIRPVSEDNPETSQDTLDYVINGRPRAKEYTQERNRFAAERKNSGFKGRVNADWDEWFLDQLVDGDLDRILSFEPHELEEIAGNGAHELRTWIAAMAAWGKGVDRVTYEPVPEWATGMGCIVGRE